MVRCSPQCLRPHSITADDGTVSARPEVYHLDPVKSRPRCPETDVTILRDTGVRYDQRAPSVEDVEIDVGVEVAGHGDPDLPSAGEANPANVAAVLAEIDKVRPAAVHDGGIPLILAREDEDQDDHDDEDQHAGRNAAPEGDLGARAHAGRGRGGRAR